MGKIYKVTVSADAHEYPFTSTTIYETEVDECNHESEAIDRVLHNDILGCGILEFEVEEIDAFSDDFQGKA
tara:strand:+ start:469 stop:681 length:213 start_codon:yes stop_codon:yes gene_type:complete